MTENFLSHEKSMKINNKKKNNKNKKKDPFIELDFVSAKNIFYKVRSHFIKISELNSCMVYNYTKQITKSYYVVTQIP